MNTWYYRQADREVGPFDRDVLDKLKHAGVIDDATVVKTSNSPEWRAFGEMVEEEAQRKTEPRYYYLDGNRQPVGPLDFAGLRRMYEDGVITGDSLASAKGDTQWVALSSLSNVFRKLSDRFPTSKSTEPLDRLSNLFGSRNAQRTDAAATGVSYPRHLGFGDFGKLMGITLTFYSFYLVPSYSRDMKAITRRERMEFTGLMVLGIVTLGFALAVMEVLWAFDLERHGKTSGTAGRQESLGIIVLVLNVLVVVLGFVIDDFLTSFVIGAVLNGGAIWLLQKEINLYAVTPAAA